MSMADLFKKVGAPLKNTRWSWGAVSETGDVFLRVWADERKQLDDKLTVRVTHHKVFADQPENLGYQERLQHIALIGAGARTFCILCRAKDTNAVPRELASFDRRMLFVAGDVIDFDGDSWLELIKRIKVDELQ